MDKRNFLAVVGSLSFLVALACASSPSQTSAMATDTTHTELRRRVAETGQLQVIVGIEVDPPVIAENIRKAQDELIQSLPAEHVVEASRFEAIPFVVLRVDANGLDAVIASPLVTSIEEDEASPSGLR